MSILVVGFNHRSADLALLERLAVPSEEQPKALAALVEFEHVQEAVILSTCNRVEVYAHVARFHPGLQELLGWLAERGDLHPSELDARHYAHFDEHAAAHLFAVAGGLDSMVVGEQQILAQVRQAIESARDHGTARGMLQRLFRQAVRVGRRVRRETAISSGARSLVDVGLDATLTELGGSLAGRTVLIVGAGKMGALTADRLAELGVARALVWNRSEDKAQRIARRLDGEVIATADLASALATADLAVCTTGAPDPIIDADVVTRALAVRDLDAADRGPLVLLDLAMPRNVEPRCADLPGVAVVDLAAVRDISDRGVTGEVIEEAQAVVAEEAERFRAWLRAIEVGPTITALRGRAEEVRRSELERLGNKLRHLDDRELAAVEALTRGIVNTLLHEPTIRLKELADGGGAEHHANALRELFDLDE